MTSWRHSLLCFLTVSLSASLFGLDPDEILGLRIWLDAQDADTVTEYRLSVSEWANKADDANPAIQVNSPEQPKYRDNQINEQPALYFDGIASNLVLESDIRTSAGGFHIFVVASGDDGGDDWARIAASWSGDGDPSAAPNWLLLVPNESGVGSVTLETYGPLVNNYGHTCAEVNLNPASLERPLTADDYRQYAGTLPDGTPDKNAINALCV